jgi:hypothetical protein
MDIVERVARAISSAASSESLPELGYKFYMNEARAAIGAMREPSEAMLDCGVAFALQVSVSGMGGWSKYVAEKHRAMIDAALTPPLPLVGE